MKVAECKKEKNANMLFHYEAWKLEKRITFSSKLFIMDTSSLTFSKCVLLMHAELFLQSSRTENFIIFFWVFLIFKLLLVLMHLAINYTFPFIYASK